MRGGDKMQSNVGEAMKALKEAGVALGKSDLACLKAKVAYNEAKVTYDAAKKDRAVMDKAYDKAGEVYKKAIKA